MSEPTVANSTVPHGTKTRYGSYRCRCTPCRTAHTDYMREYRKELAQRPRKDVPHGTRNGYVNWQCRCEQCRHANHVGNKEASQRWLAKKRAERLAAKNQATP